ncbi:c-type cytochrome [Thiocystis violascens]|uniref:Cytochrome c556 n=1 Tax=Thiocystis violascens (strain ATCC 17096 / DSM 198 / 6111) TaxID=765911 RepID=I3Y5A9_THIV6|nr:cytochrome c [Thiocystis violascens]AFL72177.1 cytochrome c556 [Thiocystis violascens DSM 198]
MKRTVASTTFGILAVAFASAAFADLKPEEQIEYRQAGYSFMSWNMGKIKANLEGDFSSDQVSKAANAIAAIANSGMGALYGPGTDQNIGEVKTRVKPELFQNGEDVGQLAREFMDAADNLAEIAAEGEKSEVQAAFADLGSACKACHKKYRADN